METTFDASSSEPCDAAVGVGGHNANIMKRSAHAVEKTNRMEWQVVQLPPAPRLHPALDPEIDFAALSLVDLQECVGEKRTTASVTSCNTGPLLCSSPPGASNAHPNPHTQTKKKQLMLFQTACDGIKATSTGKLGGEGQHDAERPLEGEGRCLCKNQESGIDVPGIRHRSRTPMRRSKSRFFDA